jgi:hypothetical protein
MPKTPGVKRTPSSQLSDRSKVNALHSVGKPPAPMAQKQEPSNRAPPLEKSGTAKHLEQKSAHDMLQAKTFVRWWNSELPAENQIADLSTDLCNGVAPMLLLRSQTGNQTKFNFTSTTRIKHIENMSLFFKGLTGLGIPLTNISAEDVVVSALATPHAMLPRMNKAAPCCAGRATTVAAPGRNAKRFAQPGPVLLRPRRHGCCEPAGHGCCPDAARTICAAGLSHPAAAVLAPHDKMRE